MKLNFFTTPVLLALASLTMLPSAAKAATITTANGDLYLGFRATGGQGSNFNYVVDLGSALAFKNAAAGTTFTVGSTLGNAITGMGADLTSIYSFGTNPGEHWYDRSDLYWGIIGGTSNIAANGTDPSITLYASREEPQPLAGSPPQATAWQVLSGRSAVAAKTAGNTSSLKAEINGDASTANNPFGKQQATSDTFSWSSLMPGGSNSDASTTLGVYNPSVEGNFANGTANEVLDLFRNQNNTNPFSFVGSFKINDSGVLTFTSAGTASVAPEPGRALLLGFGLAAALLRRRRAVKA